MKTRDLAAAAIFAALTFVVTRYTVIPIPATRGFFNLGEVVIYIAALTSGPFVGMIAGGLGSSLADVAAGYGYYAPFTLVIKGIEGLIVGWLARPTATARLRATAVGGVWMILGYFLSQVFFFQVLQFAATQTAALTAAFTEMPFNVVQVAVGIVVGVPVASRLAKLAPRPSD
ncbi:MAG TPA: ECF transporter S component [bacterium]|nr:ECF transporter S component [bacterium]